GAVEVHHGEESEAATPVGQHTLRMGHRVEATTSPDGSHAASRVSCWATARLSSGETFNVTADTTLTDDPLIVQGKVDGDGSTLLERRWQTALWRDDPPPAPPASTSDHGE
ncbi:MAG: hypothetical protein AB7Q27_26970, partial [Acidimicrobiia bacterium]